MAQAPMTEERYPSQIARSTCILGVRVHDVTLDEAQNVIEAYIRSGKPHLVVTTNTEFVVQAQQNEVFRTILNSAPLAVPDGHGLVWASPLFGRRLRAHVAGTDLVERLAAVSAQRGYRLFLLGAAEGVASEAAARLMARYPGLHVAGTFAGSPRPEDEEAVRSAISAAGKVDILLVAYGAPAQELWLARNLCSLSIPVGIGVGGVFDYLSGRLRRAPGWMRRLGLEWLYRLLRQPWRWRRQLALPKFVILVIWWLLRNKWRRGG